MGVAPERSGLAARYSSGTGVVCSVIHRLNGSRTLLNPCRAILAASARRPVRSSPGATPSSSWAPYQFTPASRTRLPSASTM